MGFTASSTFNNTYNIGKLLAARSFSAPEQQGGLLIYNLNPHGDSGRVSITNRQGETEIIHISDFIPDAPLPGEVTFDIPMDMTRLPEEFQQAIRLRAELMEASLMETLAAAIGMIVYVDQQQSFFEPPQA